MIELCSKEEGKSAPRVQAVQQKKRMMELTLSPRINLTDQRKLLSKIEHHKTNRTTVLKTTTRPTRIKVSGKKQSW
jgi:hypothetical protein